MKRGNSVRDTNIPSRIIIAVILLTKAVQTAKTHQRDPPYKIYMYTIICISIHIK